MMKIPSLRCNGPDQKKMARFDFGVMCSVMEHMCLKKIAYEYTLLRMVPRAREMVFDSLVPWAPMKDFDQLKSMADKEMEEYLSSKGLQSGPKQIEPILQELMRLWDAEKNLRQNLEKLRHDQRFRENGFYEGCVRLIRLDSAQNIQGEHRPKSRKHKEFLDKDVSRVLARLLYFWTEENDPDELAQKGQETKQSEGVWGCMELLLPLLNLQSLNYHEMLGSTAEGQGSKDVSFKPQLE